MGLLMLPLSLFLGILLTFGRLYTESEIAVMNATGIGNKFLIQTLCLAVITGLLAGANAFVFSPMSQERLIQLEEEVAAENNVDMLQKDWFKEHRMALQLSLSMTLRTKNSRMFLLLKCVHVTLSYQVCLFTVREVKELVTGDK